MKLLAKFNLAFVIVFALGLAAAGSLARQFVRANAQHEAVERARLLMEKAVVVSAYTTTQVAPLLQTQMQYSFLPQSVPQYSATEVLAALRGKYPDYSYKAAMLNPTNPRDRAVDWEADVITHFGNAPGREELVGERDTPSGRALYVARAIRITNPACLACHSTPQAAPKTLVDHYGPNNGFGWTLNDALGAHIVSVPLAVPLAQADRAFFTVMALLTAVFVLVGVTLNLMLWRLVIRPVTRLSGLADRVSLGEMDAPEFEAHSKDEIGTLAESFTRMRRSLSHAMKMLDT